MPEEHKPVVTRLELPFDKETRSRLLNGPAMRSVSLEEIVVREVGPRNILETGCQCPICEESMLTIFEQTLFEGPFGKQCVGGPHPKEYLRKELRKECDNCGVRSWTIHPDIRDRLGF